MTSIFFTLILTAVLFSFWIGTQQIVLAVMAIDFGVVTFWYQIPPVVQPFVALLNIMALAIAYFWRPMTPNLTN